VQAFNAGKSGNLKAGTLIACKSATGALRTAERLALSKLGVVAFSSTGDPENRSKITHTSTSRWSMPVRSSAPIALRYSASIRAWAHTKLIRQIVLTVMRTELNCSNAASFVMPTAANQRQASSSRSLAAVHDGHERSEFGRMHASRRPNQR
jgi:hypothetical protein